VFSHERWWRQYGEKGCTARTVEGLLYKISFREWPGEAIGAPAFGLKLQLHRPPNGWEGWSESPGFNGFPAAFEEDNESLVTGIDNCCREARVNYSRALRSQRPQGGV
jgi:hypothetical protein